MIAVPEYVRNLKLRLWVEEAIRLCQPAELHWCDGSEKEYTDLCSHLVETGTFIRLNGHFLRTIMAPHSTSTVINGINNRGQIVGFFTDTRNNTLGFLAHR